ncbi:hypothetical protein OF83DRAFT_1085317 [Amylostereum chailletii]|nr:hypothetical protein OF83DRAFT_1085317 [Amylostereum chailletii]
MPPPRTSITPSTTVFIKRDPDGDHPRPSRLAALRAAKSASSVSYPLPTSSTSNLPVSSTSATPVAAPFQQQPPPPQPHSWSGPPIGQGTPLPPPISSSTAQSPGMNLRLNGPVINIPDEQNLRAILAAARIYPATNNMPDGSSADGPSSTPLQSPSSHTQSFLASHGVQNRAQSNEAPHNGNAVANGWAPFQWRDTQNGNAGSILPQDNNIGPSLSRTPSSGQPPPRENSTNRPPYSTDSSLNDHRRDRGKDYGKDYGRSSSHDYNRTPDTKRDQLGYRPTKGYDGYDSHSRYGRDDHSPNRKRGRSRTRSPEHDRHDSSRRAGDSSGRQHAHGDHKRDWSRSTHRHSSIERDERDRTRSRWDSPHGGREPYRNPVSHKPSYGDRPSIRTPFG